MDERQWMNDRSDLHRYYDIQIIIIMIEMSSIFASGGAGGPPPPVFLTGAASVPPKVTSGAYSLGLATQHSSFLHACGIRDITTFMTKVTEKTKSVKINGKSISPQRGAALIAQEYITKTLYELTVNGPTSLKSKIAKLYEYRGDYAPCPELASLDAFKQHALKRCEIFSSAAFVERLCQTIPTRERLAIPLSYTVYIGNLLETDAELREEVLTDNRTNQAQCIAAMGLLAGTTVERLQDERREGGKRTSKVYPIPMCWICGKKILPSPPHARMECEHMFAILLALLHWWLVKKAVLTPEEEAFLRMIYDWSHRCCNQVKSNLDFIKFNPTTGKYEFNEAGVRDIFDRIYTNITVGKESYDCPAVFAEEIEKGTWGKYVSTRIEELKRRLSAHIAQINKSIEEVDGIAMYHAMIMMKILAAFSDDNLLRILVYGRLMTAERAKTLAKQQAAKDAKQAAKMAKAAATGKPVIIKARGGSRSLSTNSNYNQTGGAFDIENLLINTDIEGANEEDDLELFSTLVGGRPILSESVRPFTSADLRTADFSVEGTEDINAIASNIYALNLSTPVISEEQFDELVSNLFSRRTHLTFGEEGSRMVQYGFTPPSPEQIAAASSSGWSGAGTPSSWGSKIPAVPTTEVITFSVSPDYGVLMDSTGKLYAPNSYIYDVNTGAIIGIHSYKYQSDGAITHHGEDRGFKWTGLIENSSSSRPFIYYSGMPSIQYLMLPELSFRVGGSPCEKGKLWGGCWGGYSAVSSFAGASVSNSSSSSYPSAPEEEAETVMGSSISLPVFSRKANGDITNSLASNATLCPWANVTNFTSPSGVILKKCGDYFFDPNLIVYNSSGVQIGTHNIQFGGNRRLRKSRKRRDKIRHHSTRRRTGSSRKRGGSRKNR